MSNLTDKNTVIQILKHHNLFAKKFFGQNFLVSETVLEKIVETADIQDSDHIVEVGPGLGVLTQELITRAKKVTSIELDPKMIEILETVAQNHPNLTILHKDALRFEPPKMPYKVVANIPYNITSPLINHFLQADNPPQTITLLIQKEVAQKIVLTDPKMSVLSLQVALFGQAKYIDSVPNTAFHPAPKVESAIIHIKIHQQPIPNALEILELAKRAFKSGRKKLSNTIPDIILNLEENKLQEKRPQHLSITEWQSLI